VRVADIAVGDAYPMSLVVDTSNGESSTAGSFDGVAAVTGRIREAAGAAWRSANEAVASAAIPAVIAFKFLVEFMVVRMGSD
jgi:hypothetical protein